MPYSMLRRQIMRYPVKSNPLHNSGFITLPHRQAHTMYTSATIEQGSEEVNEPRRGVNELFGSGGGGGGRRFSLSLHERAAAGERVGAGSCSLPLRWGCCVPRAYCASVRVRVPSRKRGIGQDRGARSGIEDSTFQRGW